MERWVVKLVVLTIIFIVVFAFTLLPIKVSAMFIRKGEYGKRVISYFMCFGGGVFLGVYMLHMAPDVRILLDEALIIPLEITYPLTDLIIACGFFLMVFFENLVLSCGDKSDVATDRSRLQEMGQESENLVALRLSTYTKTQLPFNGTRIRGSTIGSHVFRPLSLFEGIPEMNGATKSLTNGQAHEGTNHTNKHQESNTKEEEPHHQGDDHDPHVHLARSLVLLLALSLHHVFEGLSIGLKQSVWAVWNLCVAVLAHEVVIAFSLGMQMVKAYKTKRKIILAAFMCSSMVPVGMIIGMALTETGNEQTNAMFIINGTLQGLATGVFIYVTFFEILQEEFGHGKAGFGKLFFMLLGFAVLALLALIPEDKVLSLSHSATGNFSSENCSCPVVIH